MPDQLELAARAAAAAFGLVDPTLELVTVSENVTFRAEDGSGCSHVVRLHRPGYHTLDELESEAAWLAALKAADISAPEPLATAEGRHNVKVHVTGEGERYAGVARWRRGVGFDPATMDVLRILRDLGALMARLHAQAVEWTAPIGFTRHRLDLEGLLGETPWWGRFWEHPDLTAAQRHLLVGARSACREVLAGYGEPPHTFSLIHADMHPGNVLVTDHGLAVIDFDDAGFGWHQYDLAVAAFDTHGSDDDGARRRALLEGYRSVRPLGDEDAALVPLFELVRRMVLIGWKADRPEVSWQEGRLDGLLDRIERDLSDLGL